MIASDGKQDEEASARADKGQRMYERTAMRRLAVVLTILAVIFWTAFGFFVRDLSTNTGSLPGDIRTLLVFLALTTGVIWALYVLSIYVAKGSRKKPGRTKKENRAGRI